MSGINSVGNSGLTRRTSIFRPEKESGQGPAPADAGRTLKSAAASAYEAICPNGIVAGLQKATVNTLNKVPKEVKIAAAAVAMGSLTAFGRAPPHWHQKEIMHSGGTPPIPPRLPPIHPDSRWEDPKTGNCNKYGLDDISGNHRHPGEASGEKVTELTCGNLVPAFLNEGVKRPLKDGKTGCESTCPDDHHLIFPMTTDFKGWLKRQTPEKQAEVLLSLRRISGNSLRIGKDDYHLVRQNEDKTYTQKFGALLPTNLDASGNVMGCPLDADHHYNRW